MVMPAVLQDLIAQSKDGEWGKGDAFDGSVKMIVVRATDFEDVQNGCPESVPRRHIPPQIAERKTLRHGDIIIETAGGGKDRPTGRTQLLRRWFVARSPLPITCASFCRFIRIDPEKAHPEYVYWLLQFLYSAGYMRQFHTQHTGVARFQYTTFATTQQFKLPSRPVQEKVAGVLSAYDDLIENNTRRIAILEEMAQALYREWFVRFRFPGHESVPLVPSQLGDIPEGWTVHPLEQVCAGIFDSEHKTAPTQAEGHPCIRTPNISRGHFLLSEVRRVSKDTYKMWTRRATPQQGDLILAREAPVGNVAIIPPKLEPCLGQRTVLIRAKGQLISPHYLLRVLLSDTCQNALVSVSSGATVAHLNLKDLRKMPILVAPRSIREQAAACLEAFDLKVASLLHRTDLLRRIRDLLLPSLISGQLDVDHLDIDVGELVTA
jgi:type I restriction enzyme S subunit